MHMRKAVMGRDSAGGVMASVGSRSIMLKPLTELANDEIKSRALPDLLSLWVLPNLSPSISADELGVWAS